MPSWASKTLLAFLLLAPVTSAGASAYLTPGDVVRIRQLWPAYEYAAKKVGVPVEILPAIHYREHNLEPGRNLGGPFMLDRGPLNDGAEFTRRIRAYERKVCELYGYPPARVSRDFRFAALVAAHELKSKAQCDVLEGACLVDSVWGYNGRASWHKGDHRQSPYVWSDPKHGVKMLNKFRNAKGEMVQFTDTRPGVMVLYAEICALSRRGAFR